MIQAEDINPTTVGRVQVDPITVDVVQGAFISIVREMRNTLRMTAYGPILYDTLDFSCGLMNPKGEVIGMSEDVAGHVVPMGLGLSAVYDKYRKDEIYPGDVFIMNDPYKGGTHLNDVAFYRPFFSDGKLLFFTGVRAHWMDIGGMVPGSLSGSNLEIFHDGLRFTGQKIIERGNLIKPLWDFIFDNIRMANERVGDAVAMLTTASLAETRLGELCQKYGADVVEACAEIILARTEKLMRELLSKLPDGEWYFENYLDNNGLSPESLPLKAKAIIEGDTLTFNLTGTCPQVPGPENAGEGAAQTRFLMPLKAWFDPDTPFNWGMMRPLRFIIPERTILNAKYPASCAGLVEMRSAGVLAMGLMCQIVPEIISAANFSGCNHTNISGYDGIRNKPFMIYEYQNGGTPATNNVDGTDCLIQADQGDAAVIYPTEAIELRQPVLIENQRLNVDAEGAGYNRSGYGAVREIRILCESATLSVLGDSYIIPPMGASGGYPGSPNAVTVIRDGIEIQPSKLPGKVSAFPLKKGDIVRCQSATGGGFGDPLDREVERVKRDVLERLVSPKRAHDVYGVVIKNGEVDIAQTEALRQQLKKQRHYLKVIASETDEFTDWGGRLCPMSRQFAAQMGVTDMDLVECVPKHGLSLRAWVKLVDDLPAQGSPLGPIGRKILQVQENDLVQVRAVHQIAKVRALSTMPWKK